VIGIKRESRQDFNSLVGIISSEQEASEELRIIFLISSVVVGVKLDSIVVEEKMTESFEKDKHSLQYLVWRHRD
jgi:hypothetical protein